VANDLAFPVFCSLLLGIIRVSFFFISAKTRERKTPMIDHFYSNPKLLQHWHQGPLEPHLNQFAQLLIQNGYSRTVGRTKLRLVAQLSQWLGSRRILLHQLDEQKASAFQMARSKRRQLDGGDGATLSLLLRHLRQVGLVPAAVNRPADGPIDRLVRDYAQFLLKERGLSPRTLPNRLPIVRRFLSYHFKSGKVSLRSLRPRDVSRFILHAIPHLGWAQTQTAATSLRSFFRFLYQYGRLSCDFSASVPTIASRRPAEPPRYLEPEQVERLLKCRDKACSCRLRDDAVLVLLARLGLRAGEVLNLTLDDINWEAGEIMVRGKSAREDRLPLPSDVGRALAAYLKHERPRCSSRRVFLRSVAPHEGLAAPSSVALIVRRAMTRAHLYAEHQGAHLLRHSLATRMLRKGASLTQIGQILRHGHTAATEVYAKVDLTSLRRLAQPWLAGGAR
jgi:site-specific recombinase XerD